MQNWPAWIPYPTSWLSAVFLALLTGGLGASAALIWQVALWFSRISPRLGLLFGAIAILSPIVLVAIVHHLVHLLMDRFFPDTQIPGMVAPPGVLPGLMSWWEGMYSWLVILVTTLISLPILGALPLSSRFLSDLLNWWEIIRPFFRWSTLVWVVIAAYLYQFENLVQQRLIAVGKREEGRR